MDFRYPGIRGYSSTGTAMFLSSGMVGVSRELATA